MVDAAVAGIAYKLDFDQTFFSDKKMKGLLRAAYKFLVRMGRRTPLRKSKSIQRLAARTTFLFKTRTANVDGHLMHLDDEDCLNLSVWGVFEPHETALLKHLIKPGVCVLDIGANIGYYTLMLARLVGPEGRVIAFEPHPGNFQLLSRNIEENGYHNVTLYQAAASDHDGDIRLYLDHSRAGQHSTSDVSRTGTSIEVPCMRVDTIDTLGGRLVDFVKMDVEGAELCALRGMERILEQDRLSMLIEFYPKALSSAGTDPRTLLEFLVKKGFRIQRINQWTGAIEDTTIDGLVQAYPLDEEIRLTDLFCSKGGRSYG